MAEKLYNISRKYNVFSILALICLFVNNLLILIFKNTAARQTFSCRFLVLCAAFVALAGILIELFCIIYRFMKSKNKLRFCLEIASSVVMFGLLLWASIKFFQDFEIYFVDNNKTNLIVSVALMCICAYQLGQAFQQVKKNLLSVCVVSAIAVVLFVLMIVVHENSNISQFYIFALAQNVSLILLSSATISPVFKRISEITFSVLASILLLCTVIANLINRTATDVYNMVYLFVILAALMLVVTTASTLKWKLVSDILKVGAMILAIIVFVKVLYFDLSLKDFDLSRLIVVFVFPFLFGALLKEYRSVQTIFVIALIGLLTLAYAISAFVVFVQKSYESKFYMLLIAFLSMYFVLAICFVAAKYIVQHKKKLATQLENEDN